MSDQSGGPRNKPSEAQIAAARASGVFLACMMASWLTLYLSFPWYIASPIFALGAIVLGVRAQLAARKTPQLGMMPMMLIVAIVFCGMMLFTGAVRVASWQAERDYRECLDAAITVQAQDECATAFSDQDTSLLVRLLGGSS